MLSTGLPDWRDAAAYAPLLEVERAMLAWEWLRRDSDYRTAARAAGTSSQERVLFEDPSAAVWGLHAFEDPALGAPAARPVWRSESYRFVLPVRAEPWVSDEDAFDLLRLGRFVKVVQGDGREHLLLSDGRQGLRIDAVGARLCDGPVRLGYRLSGFDDLDLALAALRRLLVLVRTGDFPAAQGRRAGKAGRHVLLLRARDAFAAGASQREVAAHLLSPEAEGSGWRLRASWLRSRAQRLAHAAAAMAAGRWRSLLDAPAPGHPS